MLFGYTIKNVLTIFLLTIAFCSLEGRIAALVLLEKRTASNALRQQMYLLGSDDWQTDANTDPTSLEIQTEQAQQEAGEILYWFDKARTQGGKSLFILPLHYIDSFYVTALPALLFCMCLIKNHTHEECSTGLTYTNYEYLKKQHASNVVFLLSQHDLAKNNVFFTNAKIAEVGASLMVLRQLMQLLEFNLESSGQQCIEFAQHHGMTREDFFTKAHQVYDEFVQVLQKK